mgnify:CR=1 FL=1
MNIELLDPEPATTALTVTARAALALGTEKARAELKALAAESVTITEVKNQAGREQAHGAGMKLMRARTDIEKRGKAARDDATKFSKAVIAEEKALVAIIEPEEARLLGLRDAWDKARAAEKAEAERIERARIEQIALRLADIRECAVLAAQCRTSDMVEGLIQKLTDAPLEGVDEFAEEAAKTRVDALERMRKIQDDKHDEEQERARVKAQQEAEAARLAAERAELERMRAEQEAAARVERERIAQEQATARAEAAKRDAEDRARRDEEDRLARESRAAEELRLSKVRAELEAQQRAIREAEEDKAAEARRIAQEAADAAAAAERKRLNDEAAAARAERQRKADEEEAARIADKRKRDAADVMLGALQVVAATPRIPKEVLAVVNDAIAAATGEHA